MFFSLDSVERVNLDVSALIALTSELANFVNCDIGSDYLTTLKSSSRRDYLLTGTKIQFKYMNLNWLLKSEAELPVFSILEQYLRSKF